MITSNEDNVITLEECDRAKAPNPQNYTELELIEIAEYKRLLTQRHPSQIYLLIPRSIFICNQIRSRLKKTSSLGNLIFLELIRKRK